MSAGLPHKLAALRADGRALEGIEREILGEKAASLGMAGERVEQSLEALRAFEGSVEDRAPLLRKAADAVQAYFVQRELCGLRRHDQVIADYRIPGEVLVRLGAR